MFQTFDNLADPTVGPARIALLRPLIGRLGLDGFVVPRADEHQGEYVPAASDRLRWLTGFTGSAGRAIVLRQAAALFVDGRYTVQARAQVDATAFEVLQVPEAKESDWLKAKLKKGGVLGFDPRLHTVSEVEGWVKALKPKGITLKAVPGPNPVDRIWGLARPKPPAGSVEPHPIALAGKAAADKIADVQKALEEAGEDAVVLTLPDSVAWLFNIRGSDVAHNPVVLAFAVVPAKGTPQLFVDPARVGAEARRHLSGAARIEPPTAMAGVLKALRMAGKRVRLDPATASWWLFGRLGRSEKTVSRGQDPCILPKARKNKVEIEGARAAQLRDGVAVCRYLAWLDDAARDGALDEIGAATKLEELRAETNALKEISFDSITGSGPHGAVVHYRVTEATNRKLRPGELFLVDSGGQYVDGTTDITRTIAIGKPSAEMRERFTLVLKGHIAIATVRFPKGTRGAEIDGFARRALWQAGLDYDHGTGHGVGSYLSVHEGPAGIGKRAVGAAIEPGMILSNEPGYYKEGAYGIRIENLLLVRDPEKPAGGEREMLSFETLTLAPIDRLLIVREMLTADERAWLDAYHARVMKAISPKLGRAERDWLAAATAPI